MGARLITLASLCGCLLLSACISAAPQGAPQPPPVSVARQAAFQRAAAALSSDWDADIAAGVAAAALAPLRQQLQSSSYATAPPTATSWNSDGGQGLLASLASRTAAVWTAAVQASRQRATTALAAWTYLAASYGSFVPADASAAAAAWPAQLASGATPAALDGLAAQWTAAVSSAQQAAVAAQAAAKLTGELQPYQSIADMISTAAGAVSTAQADNLTDPDVPGLLAALRTAATTSPDPSAAIAALQGPLRTLRALIGQQDSVAGALAHLERDVAGDQAMSGANAGSFAAQAAALAAAFRAAATSAQLAVVGAQIAALDRSVTADQFSGACGAGVGAGKVIAISLSRQSVTFYQDGCAVRSSLVTTGRPGLRTPTGTFHIFFKTTEFTFISPWPKGSPYYYYPSLAHFVMEFASGGFFIHDAPWEPNSQFGPGSENGFNASHGCVHIESTVMPWLYGWADIGTTVVISA